MATGSSFQRESFFEIAPHLREEHFRHEKIQDLANYVVGDVVNINNENDVIVEIAATEPPSLYSEADLFELHSTN